MSREARTLEEENHILKGRIASLQRELVAKRTRDRSPIENMTRLLATKNEQMEQTVQQLEDANRKLEASYQRTVRFYLNTVRALVHAFESKFEPFLSHSNKVSKTARDIGRLMGLDHDILEGLKTAGLLHDFGMIAVRESVIMKPATLTDSEMEHLQVHTQIAELVLEPIGPIAPVIKDVKAHHERFDGSGYLEHIAGADIPLGGRILAVADADVAMRSVRPWRGPLSERDIMKEFEENAGTQFDPDVAALWLKHLKQSGR